MRFYERRARRILPALVLVILVTTIAAVLIMTPARLKEYGASMIATAIFGANIYFWRTTDYFGTAADERPLLHMWSLAVEEQFYIVFPILLLLLWRWRRGDSPLLLWGSFLAILIGSLALAIYAAGWQPVANFYLPVTRAWELIAGSLAALALRGAPPDATRRAPWLAGLGLLLVLGALIGIDHDTPWPGPWTIIPVAGTVLILTHARADCPTGRLLGWTPFVWIGLLSYSIYLWHQPLLAFARSSFPGEPPLTLMAGLALATVPLAWFSWRYVERPFRVRPRDGGMSRRTIFSASLASLAVIIALGAVPMAAPGLVETAYVARLSDSARERYAMQQAAIDTSQFPLLDGRAGKPCHRLFAMVSPEARAAFTECTKDNRRAVIVIGGSHGIDLYYALSMASGADVIFGFARGYCRPHQRLGKARPHPCAYEGVRDLVASHSDRIALVVYTQAGFTVYQEGRGTRSAEGLHYELVEQVADYLRSLADHVPVLALGPRPIQGVDPRHLSVERSFEAQIAEAQHPGIQEALTAVDAAFATSLAKRDIVYVSQDRAIGIKLPEESVLDGKLTYRDLDHWSLYGAQIFGARFVSTLHELGYADVFPRP